MGQVLVRMSAPPEEAVVRLKGGGYDRSIPAPAARREGKQSVFVFEDVPEGAYSATLLLGGREQPIFENQALVEPPPSPAGPPTVGKSPAERLQATGSPQSLALGSPSPTSASFVEAPPPAVGSKFCTICRRPIETSAAKPSAPAAIPGAAPPQAKPAAVGETVGPSGEAERYDFYRRLAESLGRFEAAAREATVVGVRGYVGGRRVENVPNALNDTIALLWLDAQGEKRCREYLATVDPMEGPGRSQKLFLLDGQWPFRLGEVHGRQALVQDGPLSVFDAQSQERKTGDFGLMIHCLGTGEFAGSGSQLIQGNENGAAWLEFIGQVKADPDGKLLYTLVDSARLTQEGRVLPQEAAALPDSAKQNSGQAGGVKRDLSANRGERHGHPIEVIILYASGHSDLVKQVTYYKKPESRASVHYLLGRKGEIVQVVEEKDAAWHAGKCLYRGQGLVNARSLGIELLGDGQEQEYSDEQYKALSQLLRGVFDRYGLTSEDICGYEHIAPTRKGGPGRRFDWDRLRSLVES